MQIDSYDSPETEALLHRPDEERFGPRELSRREQLTHALTGGTFLITAGTLAIGVPWHRPLSAVNLLVALGVYLVAQRVKFPVIEGYAAPTELAIVPMLFVLPVPVVPLVVGLATLLGRLPDLRGGPPSVPLVAAYLGNAWCTVGPTSVLILAGQQPLAWSHWPVYVAALAAQLLFDATATVFNVWAADGVTPRVQLPLLSWVYVVDVTLAPLGLLIATAAHVHPALLLLALSPIGMLTLFARERRQRLDETVALSTAYRGTAILLGDVVEADDRYTGLHSRDVVELSLAVAEELGLDATRRRDVEFAALLHDVGKIRIPKEIINKPGALDEDEWELIRRHTIDGQQMLQQVGGVLASVGRIVRATHERYDGNGYPDRLGGEEVPIEARIICACDAFSAMTTNRPYRPAMSWQEALAELHRCSGTQFDPRVVQAIERLSLSWGADQADWLQMLADCARQKPQPLSQPASVEPSRILSGSLASS
jgi:HD-GYP domain-containing protein (c-di-GMP phosphodiesterase class II)